ncbi:MAG TPA: hypothetical protein VEY70_24395 [Metabacillus sp.]|nr:hypothetical protein [Metabacillus sp.]
MQINQELKVSSHIPSAKSVTLKEGDIYSALVKERLPQNEAILQIRGQDVKVKFEGEPPKQNQVTVEITDNKQEIPRVKTIPLPTPTTQNTNTQSNAKVLARQLNGGAPVSLGTHTAVDSLLSKGIPLNKKTFQQIQSFIDQQSGTLDQKLETISALIKKGIAPTANNIRAVHQALHDKSFASSIEEVLKVADPEFRFKKQESPANSIKPPVQMTEQEQRQRKAAVQRVTEAINLLEKKIIEPKKLDMLQQIKNDIGKKDVQTVVQNLRTSFSSEIMKAPEVSSKLADAIKLDNMAKAESQVTNNNQSAKFEQALQVKNQPIGQGNSANNQNQTAKQALSRLVETVNKLEKVIVNPKKLEMLHQIKNDIGKKDVSTVVQNLRTSFSSEIAKAPEVSSKLSDAVKLDNLVKIESQSALQNKSFKPEQIQQHKGAQQPTIDQAIMQLKNKVMNSPLPQAREIQTIISQAESIKNMAHKSVNDVLNILAKEDPSPKNMHVIKEVQEGLQQGKNIEQTIGKLSSLVENKMLTQQLENAIRLEKSGITLLQKELGKADNIQTNSGDSLQKAIQVLKKEPNMSEVFKKLSVLLDQNSPLDEKQQETLATSVKKAEEFVQNGKELGARQELMNTLTKMNQEIPALQKQHSTNTQIENTEAYNMQEELIASLPIQSKDFIVETVSKKLSQVAIDFKNFKNDLSKSLNTVEQLVQQFKSRSTVTAKPMLETIIKKLDQAILRSDFMLYADMKTEKKLLTASSQLTEAKKLLSKGDYSGANKIVTEVRTLLDKMIFKPSDVRVKHFVSQELGKLENIPLSKQVTQSFEQSMSALKQEPSARSSFEYLRNLGLTHEADHAQALVSKDRNPEGLSPSLKGLLLKMAQNDGDLLQSQKADQVLNNLTGQQLLSKNDSAGLQNLMFTLPLLLQDKLENVKVFVNSKNQHEKIDWENCSLFFLFETKKLGEVGIALTSADRTLSVKIKNDQEGFKEKMEPLAELAKQRLGDIGYKIGAIKFEPLHKNENSEVATTAAQQTHMSKMTEKGYDFSV